MSWSRCVGLHDRCLGFVLSLRVDVLVSLLRVDVLVLKVDGRCLGLVLSLGSFVLVSLLRVDVLVMVLKVDFSA